MDRSPPRAFFLTLALHPKGRFLVALFGLALLVAASTREAGTSKPAMHVLAAPAVVECPPGTLDISVVTMPASGSQAVLALRDARLGSFGIWSLDLRTGQWRRLLEPQFRMVSALGAAPTGALLVVDSNPGDVVAKIMLGGSDRTVILGRGIARSAVFDEGSESWWVGGEFGTETDRALVMRIDSTGLVSRAVSGPPHPWAMRSGNHFTGVVVRDDSVFVTAPTLCDVQEFDKAATTLRRSCGITTADSGLQLACTARLQEYPSSEDLEALKVSHAWPVALWDVGEEVIVGVRRSNREGWTLLGFDGECVPRTYRQLERARWPRAMNGEFALISRSDLDEPGQLSHLEIWRTQQLVAPTSEHRVDGEPEAPISVAVVNALPQDRPLLVIDSRRCIGDAIRETCDARSRQLLADVDYQLVLTHAGDKGRALAVASSLRRFVRLAPEALIFNGDLPADLKVLGPTVRIEVACHRDASVP